MRFRQITAAASLAFVLVTPAQAQYASTLPEFSGDPFSSSPWPIYNLGSFIGTPTANITFAQITGAFGNTALSISSAGVDVKLDGIVVAQCVEYSPCWSGGGPLTWSYTFAPNEYSIFADGIATLTAEQTAPYVIRLGEMQLTVRYDDVNVPEPGTFALLATSLLGLVSYKRTRRDA
jgi:hypothetical protein